LGFAIVVGAFASLPWRFDEPAAGLAVFSLGAFCLLAAGVLCVSSPRRFTFDHEASSVRALKLLGVLFSILGAGLCVLAFVAWFE
jgi:hypothetical protein